jgi:hypothetical protein
MYACRFSTCIEPTFWDHGGQHGQESEEGKEEVSEKEKEVTSQQKPRSIRISSDVRCALRSMDRLRFRDRISGAKMVKPDPYADGCCITVRLFSRTARARRQQHPHDGAAADPVQFTTT